MATSYQTRKRAKLANAVASSIAENHHAGPPSHSKCPNTAAALDSSDSVRRQLSSLGHIRARQSSAVSILLIPFELLLEIISRVRVADIVALSQSCRHMRLSFDERFWGRIMKLRILDSLAPQRPHTVADRADVIPLPLASFSVPNLVASTATLASRLSALQPQLAAAQSATRATSLLSLSPASMAAVPDPRGTTTAIAVERRLNNWAVSPTELTSGHSSLFSSIYAAQSHGQHNINSLPVLPLQPQRLQVLRRVRHLCLFCDRQVCPNVHPCFQLRICEACLQLPGVLISLREACESFGIDEQDMAELPFDPRGLACSVCGYRHCELFDADRRLYLVADVERVAEEKRRREETEERLRSEERARRRTEVRAERWAELLDRFEAAGMEAPPGSDLCRAFVMGWTVGAGADLDAPIAKTTRTGRKAAWTAKRIVEYYVVMEKLQRDQALLKRLVKQPQMDASGHFVDAPWLASLLRRRRDLVVRALGQ
ncbi:hypothetical protein DFJ73DRAFT_183342 [Zopfochytrium polystomum]|nr:hypothetical protein DFJ73DRAFT_183342 [Zopfochytrium polystomum]